MCVTNTMPNDTYISSALWGKQNLLAQYHERAIKQSAHSSSNFFKNTYIVNKQTLHTRKKRYRFYKYSQLKPHPICKLAFTRIICNFTYVMQVYTAQQSLRRYFKLLLFTLRNSSSLDRNRKIFLIQLSPSLKILFSLIFALNWLYWILEILS